MRGGIVGAIRAYAERLQGREDAAALRDLLRQSQHERAAAPVATHAPDSEIRALAKTRAALMLERIAALAEPVTWDWLQSQIQGLEARTLPPLVEGLPLEDQLQACVKRATCPNWWRRQLRKRATFKREQAGREECAVGKHARTLYVTNETARRYGEQQARNRAALERTTIESADGDEITLAVAADASTANKTIRRGEFMTRLRGCEEWAEAHGLAGDFATLTTPSRFHPARTARGGIKAGRNPKWDGSSAKDAQEWLCKTWAKVRAKLHREGVRIFGFRIAEPHHDGCPHWHALWWGNHLEILRAREVVRSYWIAEEVKEAKRRRRRLTCRTCSGGPSLFWHGDEADAEAIEAGAAVYRVRFERIEKERGGAPAYLAKYVAKNLDDAGAVDWEGHKDEAWGEQFALEGMADGAKRATAWASAHGIRQFQAIGQPPVGVWRELRRLPQGISAEDSQALRAALVAVNRTPMRRACWAAYMTAQGGAIKPATGYALRLAKREGVRPGVYGLTFDARPLGVAVAALPGCVYRSERKEWRPRGTWAAADREAATVGEWGIVARGLNLDWYGIGPKRSEGASAKRAQPWTRVNNCTQHPDQTRPLGLLPGRQSMRRPAPGGWPGTNEEAPGGATTEKPPWKRTNPPEPPPKSWWS